jgi:hypothetical protein
MEFIIKGTPEEVSAFMHELRAQPQVMKTWDAMRSASRLVDKQTERVEILHKEAL